MASIRTASIVGLALLSALALAGCSPSAGGGSSPTAAGSASGSASPAASASPVAVASTAAAPASGDAAASSVPKACDLVTAAEFGEVVGATVVASDHALGVYDSCAYLAGSTAKGAILVRAFKRSDFEHSLSVAPGTKTPVPGVGDVAETEVVKGLTVLVSWHAGVEVSVELHGADALTKEKAVANTVFAKLG